MKISVERKFTPAEIAEAFCDLDDEAQAQVFIEIAKVSDAWREKKTSGGAGSPTTQWYMVGRHLKTCACSTYEARDIIESIHYGMTN